MEKILIYTATSLLGYSWYCYSNEKCLKQNNPSEWNYVKNILPLGGHIPGLFVIKDENFYSVIISGIKSHRLEKGAGEIVDMILIRNYQGKLSEYQTLLISSFLTQPALNITDAIDKIKLTDDVNNLSKSITDKGESGRDGIDFSWILFKDKMEVLSNRYRYTPDLKINLSSGIAIDSKENRDLLLNYLLGPHISTTIGLISAVTYGIPPKELSAPNIIALTVHQKAGDNLIRQSPYLKKENSQDEDKAKPIAACSKEDSIMKQEEEWKNKTQESFENLKEEFSRVFKKVQNNNSKLIENKLLIQDLSRKTKILIRITCFIFVLIVLYLLLILIV